MRLLLGLAIAPLLIGLAWIIGVTTVFRPAPATTRLAGVLVSVNGYTIEDLGSDAHRLHVTVAVRSAGDVEECLGFTLDEPFGSRRLQPASGRDACIRPRAERTIAELVFDRLTEDDLRFSSHTIVWGIPGGRCGPILSALGVCVVEQAGTAALELPAEQVLPSFGGFGSFGPLFSFPAFPGFDTP